MSVGAAAQTQNLPDDEYDDDLVGDDGASIGDGSGADSWQAAAAAAQAQGGQAAGQGAGQTGGQTAANAGGAQAGAANAAAAANVAQAAADEGLTIREYLAEHGFARAAALEDDTAALEAVLEDRRVMDQRLQGYAYTVAQLQGQLQQLQQLGGQQQGQAFDQAAFQRDQRAAIAQRQGAQQQIAPRVPENWNPPKFDLAAMQYLQFDEQGRPIAPAGVDPTLPQQFLNYKQHRDQVIHQLASDPAAFLSQFGFVTQDQVEQRAMQLFEQRLVQQQSASELESIRQQHGSWLYQQDATGQPIYDPASGQPVLSQEGRMVDGTFVELVRQGVPMRRAFELASAPLQAMIWQRAAQARAQAEAAQAAAQGANGQQINGQQANGQAANGQAAGQQTNGNRQDANRRFLRGAARLDSRGGNRAPQGRLPAPSPTADFADLARESAQALGVPY